MKTYFVIILISIAFLSFSVFSNQNNLQLNDDNKYELLKKDIDEIKNQISTAYNIGAFLMVLLGFFGIRGYIDIKESLKKVKLDVHEIEKIKKIQKFRFLLEDYLKLGKKEGEYTKTDHIKLRLKAKTVVQNYYELSNLIKLNELDVFYINAIGDALFETDKYLEAKEIFDISFSLDSENPHTNYSLSFICEKLYKIEDNIYKKNGYLEERYNHIKKAVELNPFEPIYLCDLAFTYIQMNNIESAIEQFEKAIKTNIEKTRNFILEFKDDYGDFFKTNEGKKILKIIN